jgi:hypothetical protein
MKDAYEIADVLGVTVALCYLVFLAYVFV